MPPAWCTANIWCQLPPVTLGVDIGVSSIVCGFTALPPSINDALLSRRSPPVLLAISKYPFREYAATLVRIAASEVSPGDILIQATSEKSVFPNPSTLPMLTKPLLVLFRLKALPEIPPETNDAPLEERFPLKVPILSWATEPLVSSNLQWARARPWSGGGPHLQELPAL